MIHKAYKEYSYSKRDLNPHSRNGQRILSLYALSISKPHSCFVIIL